MAIPVQIGERTYQTKKAAKDYFKAMLAKYSDGDEINDEDSSDLYNLLERHPEASQKFGCGIECFFKQRTDKGTSCFWLRRHDGSETEFSYPTCVDAKGKSLYQEFAEACRESVSDDLRATKKGHFEKHADSDGRVACDISGEMVLPHECHLDHKKPMTFQVIVRTFVAANDIEPSREMLSESQDQQFATTFTDAGLAEKFVKYHHSVADLRIIKTKLNLSLGGSERILKSKKPVAIVQNSDA
ncbi:DCL family protein [Endozoicomonas sp. SESOKO1]|uniref:DCL family protein n=1 Tax=Endozoicomonas sp. SESOKO1 TaxID=2828742 RepID=UPI002147720F|nr:DCL family protein [Endozoicomonas sp. SESOKO1]